MSKLYFLLRLSLRGLSMTQANAFSLQLSDTMKITFQRNKLQSEEELELEKTFIPVVVQLENMGGDGDPTNDDEDIYCLLRIEREVSAKIYKIFEDYYRDVDKLDLNNVLAKFRVDRRREQTTYLKGETPDGISQILLDYSSQIHKELLESSLRLVRLIRWRLDCSCSHNPVRRINSMVSLDNETFVTLPLVSNTYLSAIRAIGVVEDESRLALREVKTFFEKGYDEPLAHLLFREAWGERIKSPRSALLIGVSALEVGVKHYIQKAAPESGWLIENIASPAMEKIIREYLPLLPAKCMINGAVVPPPKEIMDTLKKAIFMRNRLTHVGNQSVELGTLDEILQSIEDVLWLLDYYSGNEWALHYMRKRIVDALENPS